MKVFLIETMLFCCVFIGQVFATTDTPPAVTPTSSSTPTTSRRVDDGTTIDEKRINEIVEERLKEFQEKSDKFEAENVMDTDRIVSILVVFVVLSVVFEVALTPIFNWRIFLKHCYKKGYRTPIAVVLAFLVFWGYKLDIITDLLKALGQDPKNIGTTTIMGGRALTALLIAGGSAGIFRIFTKLGIRNPFAIDEKAKETLEAEHYQSIAGIETDVISTPRTVRPKPKSESRSKY